MKLSVFLSLVAKIAMARALHNGLCARELYLGAKTLGERGVRAADQQESELRLSQFLVELCVLTFSDITSKEFYDCARTLQSGVVFGE